MHEVKFLMGAIAGAMAENDKITYIADYPIYGTIADINAFALGAKMINPRAKVYLDWRSLRDNDVLANIEKIQPSCVSARDILVPNEEERYFGIYYRDGQKLRNLAMPLIHWGKFYEQLIRAILNGSWEYDEESSSKAINYWWGMSAGVTDVVCSRNLPIGTKRLIELLKKTMMDGEFNPFTGMLFSQTGKVQSNSKGCLTAEEIVTMDWLAENVIGYIPDKEELVDSALPVFLQQGIDKRG
jgi:basic membrane lipoprotein Med (substrate-binding protein (PBP1-ABC) superfamily)